MSGVFAPFQPLTGLIQDTTPGTLIQCGALAAYIKKVVIYNTSSLSQSVQFFLAPSGGGATQFTQVTLGAGESADVLDDGESITLTTGDSLQAQASTGALVTYSVTGVLES